MEPSQSSRRIFLGIPVTEKDCPKFFSWTQNLKLNSEIEKLDIRWSKSENYHITLTFLGDSDNHPIRALSKAIQQELFSPFWVQIQELEVEHIR